MRHSADLGDVSCSLYLLVESVRVPGQPLQPQCSVYTSLLIRSHLLSQENQHNHHKCNVDASMLISSLVYSSEELCRIILRTYTHSYASTQSITLSRASIELCMYVLDYSGQCSVEELVTLSLSIFSILTISCLRRSGLIPRACSTSGAACISCRNMCSWLCVCVCVSE